MRELSEAEVEEVSGGEINYAALGAGIAMFGVGVLLASTAGIALAPAGLLFAGAGFSTEVVVGSVSLGLATGGGYLGGFAFVGGSGPEDEQ